MKEKLINVRNMRLKQWIINNCAIPKCKWKCESGTRGQRARGRGKGPGPRLGLGAARLTGGKQNANCKCEMTNCTQSKNDKVYLSDLFVHLFALFCLCSFAFVYCLIDVEFGICFELSCATLCAVKCNMLCITV